MFMLASKKIYHLRNYLYKRLIIQMETFEYLALGVLLLTIGFALWILKGYLAMKQYARNARKLGLKVYEHPYAFLGSGVVRGLLRSEKKYGHSGHEYIKQIRNYDITVSNMMNHTFVELINPDLVKEFYQKANEGYFEKVKTGTKRNRQLLAANSLFFSQGQIWKDRKKTLSEVFNYEFIKNQLKTIDQICKDYLKKMETENRQSDEKGAPFTANLSSYTAKIFGTVILKSFFKTNKLPEIPEKDIILYIYETINHIMTVKRYNKYFILEPLAKYHLFKFEQDETQKNQKMRKYVNQIINNRMAEIEQEDEDGDQSQDILGSLIKASKRKNTPLSQTIDREVLINEFLIFTFAGTDTTANFTRTMINKLVQNPWVMQKVREEIQNQLGDEEITYEGLKKLTYFNHVQKQVLRVDSPVLSLVYRQAMKDFYLGQLKIYKGMYVTHRIVGTSYLEQNYKNPEQFNPDRWYQLETSLHPFGFTPFSAGARTCIGKHLALLENKIFMVNLLRRYSRIENKTKEYRMLFRTTNGPSAIETVFYP